MTPKVYYSEPGSRKRRQGAALQSPEGFRGKRIRVHSRLTFKRAAHRLGGALHRQYRQEALRYGRPLRVRLGGTVDATARTLAALRLQSLRIPSQSPPVKDDAVHQ